MFIIVKFGADEEQLFNPDCTTRVLMHAIKERCDCCDDIETISLLDEKGKSIVKTPDISSMENVSSYFNDRSTYILLKCEKDGDIVRYKPLLQEPGKDLSVTLESLTVGTMGKPIKSSHSRKTSRTPQPTTAKQTSGGRNRKK